MRSTFRIAYNSLPASSRSSSPVCPQHYRQACPSAILSTGGPGVIRKEAWRFYRTIPGVRLCWELEGPKGPKGRGDRGYSIIGSTTP